MKHNTTDKKKQKNCNFLLHFKPFPDDYYLNCRRQVTLVATVFTFPAGHRLLSRIFLKSALFWCDKCKLLCAVQKLTVTLLAH